MEKYKVDERNNMSRRSEQGSIPAFIIIGVLLTAALIGAVVVVRNLQTSNDKVADVPKTSTQNTSDTKDAAEPSTDATKNADDQALKDALNAQSNNKNNNTAPAPSTSQSSSGNSSTPSATPAPSTTSLPKTGPESALISVLGASLLVGTGLAYARSRRLV